MRVDGDADDRHDLGKRGIAVKIAKADVIHDRHGKVFFGERRGQRKRTGMAVGAEHAFVIVKRLHGGREENRSLALIHAGGKPCARVDAVGGERIDAVLQREDPHTVAVMRVVGLDHTAHGCEKGKEIRALVFGNAALECVLLGALDQPFKRCGDLFGEGFCVQIGTFTAMAVCVQSLREHGMQIGDEALLCFLNHTEQTEGVFARPHFPCGQMGAF